MPNIASFLKSEITRIARKEIRSEVAGLRKQSAQQRTTIAAFRRQVDELTKQVRRLGKQAAHTGASSSEDPKLASRRFSPTRLAAHRSKLGLSAASYGALAKVSSQTIYNWEQGKSRPNKDQLEQLAAVRAMSRRSIEDKMNASA